MLSFPADGRFDLPALVARAQGWPGLEGMDLARQVSCTQSYVWTEGVWAWPGRTAAPDADKHVVAVDYGAKRNILRCLAQAGCRVTVVPATATAEDILRHQPDGVFLSNGPGDPAATGVYAVPAIQGVLEQRVPVFGICLGHQLLALALGATTYKLERGHRGANQPVKDLVTGKVEITSQNHGFAVDDASLPPGVRITHRRPVRREQRGDRVRRPPGVQRAVSSGGEPGAERQPASVPAVRGDDGGGGPGTVTGGGGSRGGVRREDRAMGAMTIEGLKPEVEAALAARAARNGRSVGDEARAILEDAVLDSGEPVNAADIFAEMRRLLDGQELTIERDRTPAGSRAFFEP